MVAGPFRGWRLAAPDLGIQIIVIQLLVRLALAREPVWQTVEIYKQFSLTISKTEAIVLGTVTVAGFIAELIGIFARKTILQLKCFLSR